MIGKVLRGTNAGRLLYYLYGPGKANEHTDPHLIAGFGDPAELEPERRPGGSRDLRRLSGLLAQPLAALAGPGFEKPVWHCAVRAAPEDRLLSDAEWAQVAAQIMDRTGLAPAVMIWGCGGWRSATPRITFTWWRRWPVRTAPGRGSGTTSTGCGRRARPLSRGSGCGPPLRRIAPRRGVRPGPRRSRRRGAAGRSRPG